MKLILWKFNKGIDKIVYAIALILLLVCTYVIIDHFILQYMGSDDAYKHYIGENGDPDFDKLRAINPEIIAWIRIDNTNIDYPICQSTDNSKYIYTDAFGKKSATGAIFLDCENKPDFSDYYNVLYGHQMEGDRMFGGLVHFKDQGYLDGHYKGTLFYPGGKNPIEVFCGIPTDLSNHYLFTPKRPFDANLIPASKSQSASWRELGDKASNRVLAMTTCNVEDTNGRTIALSIIK
ncbi:MAG: class B sortase [Eubacteriaceae bacterium]|nr:class B sortase [Eubacteriaceae bacterium]